MQFHTDIDVFDMLALFTLSTAERGGDQYLASMTSIYNILATEDAKILQTLSQDWYWERKYRYACPLSDSEFVVTSKSNNSAS
jgi:Taurine catabolism dioxygenase TauD, TfdA family